MLAIRGLEINLSGDQWSQTSDLPSLQIKIKPTKNGKDICSIGYLFNDGRGPVKANLDEDLIECITTQMTGIDTADTEWEAGSSTSGAVELLDNLQVLLQDIPDEDIYTMTASYGTIFPSDSMVTAGVDTRQLFIDTFISQVSIYLVICHLLYEDKLWSLLPVTFELPFDTMDGRMLTENAMKFMRFPLRALKIMGGPFVRELEWLLVSFFNGWTDNYTEGDIIQTNEMVLSLLTSISEATLSQIDARTELGLSKLESDNGNLAQQVQYLTHLVSDLASRLERLESGPGSSNDIDVESISVSLYEI